MTHASAFISVSALLALAAVACVDAEALQVPTSATVAGSGGSGSDSGSGGSGGSGGGLDTSSVSSTSTASASSGGEGGSTSSGGGAGGGVDQVDAIWSARFGSSPKGYRSAFGVAVDADESAIVIGYLDDDAGNEAPCRIAFGADTLVADGQDGFVTKLDDAGVPQWSLQLSSDRPSGGGYSDVDVYDVAVDSEGNVVVVGSFYGEWTIDGETYDAEPETPRPFALRLDPSGEMEWFQAFPGSGDIRSVAIDTDGDIVLGGNSYEGVDVGAGPFVEDNFVAKLASDGSYLTSLEADSRTGGFGVFSVATGPDGAIAVIGSHDADSGTNGLDVWLRVLGPDLEERWSRTYGGPEWQTGWDVAFDAEGGLFLAVTFESTLSLGGETFTTSAEDLAVAKLSPTGDHVYSHAIGPVFATCCHGPGIAVDTEGSLLVAGTAGTEAQLDFGGVSFSADDSPFLAKLDPQGAVSWVVVPDGWLSSFQGVGVGPSGEPRVAGSVRHELDLGAGPMTAVGLDGDVLVAAFPP